MSIPCTNRVWELSKQKGAARLLLLALADYATCFPLTKTGSDGFAWPGLETLARKTCLSSRHLSRLVAALQAVGELLVLPRPGRSHLYIVLTGTDAQCLSAALQRAADRGASVDGLLEATLDRLSATQDVPHGGAMSSPTPDIAMSSPTPDRVSSPP